MTTTKTKESRMTTPKTKECSPKDVNFKNETQEKHFNLWLNECISFAPLSTITLRDAYSNYCHLLDEHLYSVPLSKKLFSINLRLAFKKKIEETKIVFFTRSCVFIKGIKLTEFNYYQKQTKNSSRTYKNYESERREECKHQKTMC